MLCTAFIILLVYSTLNIPIILLNRLGIITFIYALYLNIISINIIGISSGITLFNNWFNLTLSNIPIIIIIYLITILLLIYNTSNNKYEIESRYLTIIIMINIISLLLLPITNDIISLYIIIELQSYSLYILTGLHNRSYNGLRASLLYFLMGGIASCIILLSSYYIYYWTGSTNLSDIYIYYSYNKIYDYFDILLIALLFKMGLAPLHRWSISVYNYAPTYITAYISIVAKISIISWIFTNSYLFNNYIFIIFFYISIFIGCYKPLFEINIKTILAYSGLLNFGYILLTIITYDISFYIYIIQYTLTHIIIFISLLACNQYIDKPISIWSPIIYINQLKIPNITLIFCIVISIFSLIGIPPLPGFYAKLYLLKSIIQDNYILESISIIITSVIATFFYANIIRIIITNYYNTISINYYINSSLAFIISSLTCLLINFFIFIPSLSEALYLIIL